MNKELILSQLDRSYRKLLDALEIPATDPLAVDGTIHRFEFTYDLACRAVDLFFADHLPSARTNGLREAVARGLVADPETWRNFMRLKFQAAYAFGEPLARDIYDTIRKDHHAFDRLIENCRRISVPPGSRPDSGNLLKGPCV